ncbi:MAG: AbrB/MazE/SpoVT family DNA-binding domain-containing protein [Pirellulaceae bacterium]|nr:AbrB/MazE/SpoVT family DNA-binding domain-containing protein [Planctomycetales bacterium]
MRDITFHVRLTEGRRVVLPARACKELELSIGDTLILTIEDGDMKLRSVSAMLNAFQKKLRTQIGDRSLVNELIAERREEASRE